MKSLAIVAVLMGLFESSFAEPNHLIPITAYNSNGYDQAVFKSLIRDINPKLWMVVRPSFEPEYAVIVYRKVEYKKENNTIKYPREIIKDEWFVERVEPRKKIWAWKDVGDGKQVLDIHPTTDIIQNIVSVEPGTLDLVLEAWEAAIKGTKYPSKRRPGLDGTTYQFYSTFDLFGETWSPDEGLPKKMVDSGKLLEQLAIVELNRRPEIIKRLNNISLQILENSP